MTRIEDMHYITRKRDMKRSMIDITFVMNNDDEAIDGKDLPRFHMLWEYNTDAAKKEVQKMLHKATTKSGHDYYVADKDANRESRLIEVLFEVADVSKVMEAVDTKGDVYMWLHLTHETNEDGNEIEMVEPVSVDELPDEAYYQIFPEEKK